MITGRIFLVGCPRSGTTLLQSLLAAHPEIASFPETHFFEELAPRRPWAKQLGLASTQIRGRFERIRRDLGDGTGVRPPVLPFRRSWAAAFVRLLDETALVQRKTRWLEKTPGHVAHVDEITRYVPQATFIHLLRNGADVVASLFEVTHAHPDHWGGPWTVERCIARWIADVHASLRYRGRPGHALVAYESVVSDPATVLAELCGFLGVDFDPAMLSEYRRTADSVVLPSEPWKFTARSAIRPQDPGKFRALFTPDQQQHVLHRVAEIDLEGAALIP